jgi:hypothetical protein
MAMEDANAEIQQIRRRLRHQEGEENRKLTIQPLLPNIGDEK